MKTLYFDCFSGVSGNMILGGLVSLGVKPESLKNEIAKLNISEFGLDVSTVNRCGISAVHVRTVYEEERQHRHLSDIEAIIGGSSLSESIKQRSIAIFRTLAIAEAAVHGVDIEKVHFHEVGAMDAIIDVVGACIGFEMLGVEEFSCSKIHTGSGFVETQHGRYPVPPPAVSEILKGIPIYSTDIVGELATPTGAAILATVCTKHGVLDGIIPEKTGYGAGTREYESFPNALRMILGDSTEKGDATFETLALIEANLDDATGETLGYFMDAALEAGALDCWFTAVQMKKNRPGTIVSVLCRASEKEKLTELLYTETSTIGVRTNTVTRECLEREIETVETPYGPLDIKIAKFKGKAVNIKPEFDQMAAFSKSNNISLKQIISEISAICADRFKGVRIVGTTATGGPR